MDWKETKKILKKVWWFIWESDSIWSWIVNIILAFILIKFVVYPGLGFALSTTHPIVAVVSGSMQHDGSFDTWWQSNAQCNKEQCTQAEHYLQYNITKDEFKSFKFKNGFNKGDIMVLYGSNPKNINVGDVIVFQSKRPDPIIHRVVKKWEIDGKVYFKTKGDHNTDSIESASLDETNTPQNHVIGKAVVKIPYLGWIKIAAVNLLSYITPR